MKRKSNLTGVISTCMMLLAMSWGLLPAQTYQWGNTVGGTSFDTDSKIVTDNVGNIYTIGSFRNTVDFDPADVPDHVPPELVKFCDFRTNLGAYPQEQLGKLHDGPRIFYTPVAHQDRGTRGAWVLTKAEDIRYVLQNAELFSSAQQPRSQTGC